jgi:hypothetical protein
MLWFRQAFWSEPGETVPANTRSHWASPESTSHATRDLTETIFTNKFQLFRPFSETPAFNARHEKEILTSRKG